MGTLSGLAIAVVIHSVYPSLSRSLSPSLTTQLIPRLMICSKAINGIDGARDGDQNSRAGYSEIVETRADFFN